jgi:ATP-dependent Clp protease protease subunit
MNGIKNDPLIKKDREDDLNVPEEFDKCFFENRIHFLSGNIEEDNIKKAIQWIVFENARKHEEGMLTLYINSQGGELYQAFALIDVMRSSIIPIRTIGIGSIMSSSFLIFVSGTKGQRYIGKNTGIMCHQYSDEMQGKHHDIKSWMKESDHCNSRMLNILSASSDLDVRTIKSKLLNPTDMWLDSKEMVTFGLADHILE